MIISCESCGKPVDIGFFCERCLGRGIVGFSQATCLLCHGAGGFESRHCSKCYVSKEQSLVPRFDPGRGKKKARGSDV